MTGVVTGTFEGITKGIVEFRTNTADGVLRDPSGNVLWAGPKKVRLVSGELSVVLPATDDTAYAETDWQWCASIKLDGRTSSFLRWFELPEGTTVELASIAGELAPGDPLTHPVAFADVTAALPTVVVPRSLVGTDVTTEVQALIDSFGGGRGVVEFPDGDGMYTFTANLDVKTCTLRGGKPGTSSGDGTVLHFDGDYGIYSSVESNAGYGLENMRVEGSNGGTVTDADQVLVDFTGQNYPQLSNVRIAFGGVGIRLEQGTGFACNYGSFQRVNIDKCYTGVEGLIAGGLGNNTHEFYGGRIWACSTAVHIGTGLSNWNFWGTAFEANTVAGVNSGGLNINFFGARFENPALTGTGGILSSLYLRSGAGRHNDVGSHWSSGLDVIDENDPGVVETNSRKGGGERTAPTKLTSSRNLWTNLQNHDSDGNGIPDGMAVTQSTLGSGYTSSVVADYFDQGTASAVRMLVAGGGAVGVRYYRTVETVPGYQYTISFRYREVLGNPMAFYISDGTSTTTHDILSVGLVEDDTERRVGYTFKALSNQTTFAWPAVGGGTEARDFYLGAWVLSQGDAKDYGTPEPVLVESGGTVYGPLTLKQGVLGVGEVGYVKKPSDTARTNSTLAADPHLTLPVAASGVYEVTGFLIYDGPAAAGDAKFGLSGPAGYSTDYTVIAGAGSVTAGVVTGSGSWGYDDEATLARAVGAADVGTKLVAQIRGFVDVSSTAGDVAVTWAQSTTNATALTVYAGSRLVLRRIA